MVRTSKNQPSLDAGAVGGLDALDLDDMFADDVLFEGLDVQLEDMGDIITQEKKDTTTTPKSTASTRGGGGPRTKRPPPPSDDDALDLDSTTPKRRKTKRKTKTPVAFGDDDDEYLEEQQPKKKSRKSGPLGKKGKAATASPPPTVLATTSSKKKKTKKGEVPAAAPTTSKSKKLASGSSSSTSMIPPPTAGSIAMGTSSTVAAAGRFGKRGAGGTSKVKRSSSSKLKSSSSSAADSAAAAVSPAPAAPPMFVPKQESTHGGLHPSKTHFYPFLEGVPQEPSMKRKQFSLLDKISSALHSSLNQATTPGPGGKGGGTATTQPPPDISAALAAGIDMNSPIIQLLLESFEGISEKDKIAFGDTKKQALLASIPELRSLIQGMDTSKLLADLYGSCGLLTRQHNFLKACLSNMESWCKANFTDTDYRHAFSLPEPFRPEKVGTIITPANRKWKKSIITVKVAFAGHKDVKGTPPLLAKMPPVLVLPPEKKKKEEAPKKKKKKATEKSTTAAASSTPKASSAAAAAASKVPSAPKAYAECPPPERRERILERVAQLALALESQLNHRRTKRSALPTSPSAASSTTSKGPAPPPEKAATVTASYIPDEEPPLHTARMWEWLEVAGFFNSTASSSNSDGSSSKHASLRLQSPEIYPRGLLLPTPTRIQGRTEPNVEDMLGEQEEDPNIRDEKETAMQISSNGLYDRLQSLLVVEDDFKEGDKKDHSRYEDDSDSDSDSDDDLLGFLEEDTDDEYYDLEKPKQTLADLSKLSMEERTFIHLCSIGLIKKSLFPMVELVLEDNHGRKDDAIEDDLVNVIGEMSADLSTLTARNNARIGFLEAAMDPMEVAYRKQLEEEQAALISKCQSLLKRSKEKAKKSSRQRNSGNSNKDDLNLPW